MQANEMNRPSRWGAALEDELGVALSAEVINFDGDSIELGFPRADAPLLGVAQQVVVRVSEVLLGREHRVTAYVVARTDDAHRRTYELLPRNRGDLADLKRTNRGHGVRVRPSTAAPFDIDLRDRVGQRLASGNVIDVSTGGMGIILERSDELALRAHESLTVVLKLSGETRHRTLKAFIRSRRLIGALIRIGLEFEPQRSEAFIEAEQWLTRYVMRRQYETALDERTGDRAA
jgi:hypothetical protein